MLFFLGTHHTHWLGLTDVPLFISARRLRARKSLPTALGPWALDSGGFTELSMHGKWTISPEQYADEARRWMAGIGRMQWAAPQDWMCEPFMVEKTGLTIQEHQRLTVANYLDLRRIAPDMPFVPVLQGWAQKDYLAHVEAYRAVGIDLASLPLVGLGSVCRRQGTVEAEQIVFALASEGIRLHLFGFKLDGLRRCADLAVSSDSMAWSAGARYNPPLPGCAHKNCANCLKYALIWREKALEAGRSGLSGKLMFAPRRR